MKQTEESAREGGNHEDNLLDQLQGEQNEGVIRVEGSLVEVGEVSGEGGGEEEGDGEDEDAEAMDEHEREDEEHERDMGGEGERTIEDQIGLGEYGRDGATYEEHQENLLREDQMDRGGFADEMDNPLPMAE